ncbi:hypothetical protein H6785_03625 [Candidatus Nomurabacteria bacterium]|nr:hypothetical protein [Candidatus Kaiserbacteria bacterium]MCB9815637.1 hypothetical protein [Candidatus Nomurabacteria bacterium]
MSPKLKGLDILQKISMSLMGVLVLITFIGANLQALTWQSSDWLVSTVLPAVVVELTNEERTDNLAQPLQRNVTLDAAAKMKAQHMAKNQYFAHFSPDGVSPWYWFDEAGYVYAHAGENLAIHFTDSSEVVEAWMNSPTHRQNIVNGLYTEIGVGTAKGKFEGYDTVYVVQLFGTPAIPPAPVQPKSLAVATQPQPPVVVPEPEIVPEIIPEVTVEPAETVLAQSETAVSGPEPERISEELFSDNSKTELTELTVEPEQTVPESMAVAESEPEVVVIESPVISTSSGLAVAQIDTYSPTHAGATIASVVTQPNVLLQIIYFVLAVAVVLMLGTSIVLEARRMRLQQVAYGLLLLFGMGGLWFINSLLTTGAVVV